MTLTPNRPSSWPATSISPPRCPAPNAVSPTPWSAADHAAARFAPPEEHRAVSIALELLAAGDERSRAAERAARAAVLAGEPDTALRTPGSPSRGQQRPMGRVRPATSPSVSDARRKRSKSNSGWPFGELADPHRGPRPDRSRRVQLLAWQVEQRTSWTPTIPASPSTHPRDADERSCRTACPRRRPRRPPTTLSFGSCLHGRLPRRGRRADSPFGCWRPGLYREAARFAERVTNSFQGYTAVPVVLSASIGRLHLVLGELDVAAAVQAEGEQLLERWSPARTPRGSSTPSRILAPGSSTRPHGHARLLDRNHCGRAARPGG